jgi:hypothetical protein
VGYWSDEWRVGGKSGAKIQFGSFCVRETIAEGKLKELILMVINHEKIAFRNMCIINDSSTKKIIGKVRLLFGSINDLILISIPLNNTTSC